MASPHEAPSTSRDLPATSIDSAAPGGRIASLDGLRGIAASMVVISHAVSALAKEPMESIALHRSALALISNGGGGVHIFFVLSGFCLAGPALGALGVQTLSRFYVRRALRIYLPYVVGLGIAWILSGWVYERTGDLDILSRSMVDLRRIHISPEELMYSLRFPGEAFIQLPVGWTLRIEGIFSILMPGMIWVALRGHWAILVALGIPSMWIDAQTDWDFLRFTIDFSLGIAIYRERKSLAGLMGRLNPMTRLILVAAGWLLLAAPVYFILYTRAPVTSLALYVSGAAILVAGAIHIPELHKLLTLRPVAWIGRISYSVYLLHVPVIILLTPYLDHRLGPIEGGLFVAACLTCTYIVSPLLYFLVEEPSIRLGHWASDSLRSGGNTA
jgi:peptidoglycan/LPS O-acetylase OafA/YrhL